MSQRTPGIQHCHACNNTRGGYFYARREAAMSTFRIAMIPFYFFVAVIDFAAGITRLAQGETETGVLYLTLAVLFATFAVEKISETRSAE